MISASHSEANSWNVESIGPTGVTADAGGRQMPLRVRTQLRRLATEAACGRRFAPRLRHAHAVEMAREGVPLNVIQRQHTDLGVTCAYLQGIDNDEVINTVNARTPPMMSASAGLRL